MPIDLSSFKGVTLDEDKFNELQAAFAGEASKREAAAQESITRRISNREKDAEIAKLNQIIATFRESAGLDPDADLSDPSSIPSIKGLADQKAQEEARRKRLERDYSEALKRAEAAEAARLQLHRDVQIDKVLSGHKVRNRDDVRVLIKHRIESEGDELLFKTDDGKLVGFEDGVAAYLKSRPDYLEAAPVERGSGFRGQSGPSGGSSKSMSSAEFAALQPKQRAAAMAEGYQITD